MQLSSDFNEKQEISINAEHAKYFPKKFNVNIKKIDKEYFFFSIEI